MNKSDIERKRIQNILNHIPPGSTVLDIGAAKELSNGESPHRLIAEHAKECVGIDNSKSQIEDFPEYDIRHENAETFDLDQMFDVAVAGELIEHLNNPGLMLDRVSQHLKPNGKLVITTPYPWTFLRLRQAVTGQPFVVPDHVSWYCPETIENLLNRYGFKVVDTSFVKPRNIGISWVCYQIGLKNLGGIGFVTIAEKH